MVAADEQSLLCLVQSHPCRAVTTLERPLTSYLALVQVDRGNSIDVLQILIEQMCLGIKNLKLWLGAKWYGSDDPSSLRIDQSRHMRIAACDIDQITVRIVENAVCIVGNRNLVDDV